MDLKDFIAIRGKGDLYRVISKTPKGIVVETLNEKRSKFKVQPNLQVLVLSDITIYSKDTNDIFLGNLFIELYKKAGSDVLTNSKSEVNEISELFRSIAPNYDEEKVYISDMKKTLRWYHLINEYFPDVIKGIVEAKEKADAEPAEETKEAKVGSETIEKEVKIVKKPKTAAVRTNIAKPQHAIKKPTRKPSGVS